MVNIDGGYGLSLMVPVEMQEKRWRRLGSVGSCWSPEATLSLA